MLPSAMAQVIADAFCWQHAKRSVTLCYHTSHAPQVSRSSFDAADDSQEGFDTHVAQS